MSRFSLLKKLLNIGLAVVESARFDEDGSLLVTVGPRKSQLCRCRKCGRRAPAYDVPAKARRRRALDFGATEVFLEYKLPRVECPSCGVHSAAVPWARHASRFTHDFEDRTAWLCAHCNRSVVAQLMRIDWKSVGGVCGRVCDRLDAQAGDRFDGLGRIGIDETGYKKGRKHMTVVLDHDTGRVAWCGKGRGKAVLESFFDLLAEGQRASIGAVTADGARRIADVVGEKRPNAERAMGPFHVADRMTEALDEVRKQAWRRARESEKGEPERAAWRLGKGDEKKPSKASEVEGSKYVLLRNPDGLTEAQSAKLAKIAREDRRLYSAYLLKEDLRDVFKSPDGAAAAEKLDRWLNKACHSWTDEVKELSKKVRRHREAHREGGGARHLQRARRGR